MKINNLDPIKNEIENIFNIIFNRNDGNSYKQSFFDGLIPCFSFYNLTLNIDYILHEDIHYNKKYIDNTI